MYYVPSLNRLKYLDFNLPFLTGGAWSEISSQVLKFTVFVIHQSVNIIQ